MLVAVLVAAAPCEPPPALVAAPAVQGAAAPASGGRVNQRPAARGAAAADPVADAYAEFVLARQREDQGDVDGALAALQRAMKLDPKSADLPAELAGLYARQSRVREAIEAANAALAINPGHGEANRVLGSIYASFAERDPD